MSAPALNDKWQKLQWHGQRWLHLIAQRLAAVGVPRWKVILTLLLAAWVLTNLARLVWLLLPLPNNVAVAGVAPVNPLTTGVARVAKSAVDIDAMVAWHLFGEVGAQPPRAGAAAVEEQAQETTLNLQLQGLVSASDPAQSIAIIMADGTPQHLKVGEQLPGAGKVVLNKVMLDRVIIDNNGHFETLWLYDPTQTARQPSRSGVAQAEAPAQVDKRTNPQITAMAQNYRQQLYKNPSSLADVVQVAPANENGKLIGYRIHPGRDAKQFEQFGFKPGDIVTSINGVSLDDPQHALELYNLIRSAQDASFTVRRGEGDVTLSVSLQAANQEEVAPQTDNGAQ
ncbi:MAG TPA: type II secretion system protein GspC [Spongiibacteraceae bacterium]|nr:type II secretion system protein GspC [Spongiibacteraceae bacterium]